MKRCVIAGGGPAGAYLAIELIRRGAGYTVDLHAEELDSGVGIVLESDFVAALVRNDPVSGTAIEKACERWDVVRLRVGGLELATGGHVICGIGRARLIRLLHDRARSLGVTIHSGRIDPRTATSADVLVGADGVGSLVRAMVTQPELREGRNRYLWMRADAHLDAGFWFHRLRSGALVAHVYPYATKRGAVVVEGSPEAIAEANLDTVDRLAAEERLTALFAGHLGGARLHACTWPWQPFRTVQNQRWQYANVVLIGDAAHTTHYSVGSGTRLALEDAMTLGEQLAQHTAGEALPRYEAIRRPVVDDLQAEARSSELWFEGLDRHLRLPPAQFAFALRTRRSANTFGWLRQRDPAFTDAVLRIVADQAGFDDVSSQTLPHRVPLRIGDRVYADRSRIPVSRADRAMVMVEEAGWEPERADQLRAAVVIVPAGTHGGRVERTASAERLRNEFGLTVLLSADGLPVDEVDTLVAAGRIDGVAHLEGFGEGSVPW